MFELCLFIRVYSRQTLNGSTEAASQEMQAAENAG